MKKTNYEVKVGRKKITIEQNGALPAGVWAGITDGIKMLFGRFSWTDGLSRSKDGFTHVGSMNRLPKAKELKSFMNQFSFLLDEYGDHVSSVKFYHGWLPLDKKKKTHLHRKSVPWYLKRGPRGGLVRINACEGRQIGIRGVLDRYYAGNDKKKAFLEFKYALDSEIEKNPDFDLGKVIAAALRYR
jgi:hypothetical protein